MTVLGEYDDIIITGDVNFNFHYYFEVGETYYLLLTSYLDMNCSYDFYIDYVGKTYTYLENLAVGPYCWVEGSVIIGGENGEDDIVVEEGDGNINVDNIEVYLPDVKAYVYDETEDAYYLLEDGVCGGKIYVDMLHATVLFPNKSLYQIAIDALNYAETERPFYINGVDYSEYLADIGYGSMSNSGMYYGYAALNKELFEVLTVLSGQYGETEDSWQLLCYYVRTLGI